MPYFRMPGHICDWICKKGSYTCNYKYDFEIFNSIYLQNDWSCLHVFLHKSIAIRGNSLYLLYTGQLAGFPAMLDSFLLAQPIPLALLQGGRLVGGQVATKWQAKATSSLKTGKSLPFVPFSPPHVTQSISIHGQTHQPVLW